MPNEERTLVTIMAIMECNKIVVKEAKESLEDILKFSKTIKPHIKSQPTITNIKLGMPCICPYSGDGLWYRAQIYDASALDCGYAIVFFVDFGNIESVAIDKIKMMKPDWFKFPATCHIALLNFDLKTTDRREYVYQHVQKLFGVNKVCEVISKDPLTIHLYDDNEELNYKSLVESGFIILK